MYKCEGCGHTQDQPGMCPNCNAELKQVENGGESPMGDEGGSGHGGNEDETPEGM